MAESKEMYYKDELKQEEDKEQTNRIKTTQEILHQKKEQLLNDSENLEQFLKTIDSINNKIVFDKEFRNKVIIEYGDKAGYNNIKNK